MTYCDKSILAPYCASKTCQQCRIMERKNNHDCCMWERVMELEKKTNPTLAKRAVDAVMTLVLILFAALVITL